MRLAIELLLLLVSPAALPKLVGAETSAPSHALGEATIVWGGDIHLGRSVAEGMEKTGHHDPFDHIAPYLADADLRVANLEGPLTTAPRAVFGYYLTGDPDRARLLSTAGFDVLGLANNHATDNGGDGLDETLSTLSRHGISAVGAGDPDSAYEAEYVEVNGLRIALLAFNYIVGATGPSASSTGVAEYDRGRIESAVAHASKTADVVIVAPHWGVEYMPAANGHQHRFARDLVGAGADAVIGHHPHVVQDIEWLPRDGRRPALVAYSLGNFVFDSLDPDAMRGALLWTVIDRSGVKRFRALPLKTDWLGVEPLLTVADRQSLERRLMPHSGSGTRLATGDGQAWFGPPVDQLSDLLLELPRERCVWTNSSSTEPLGF